MKNLLEACTDYLRDHPWSTAGEIAQALGLNTTSVSSVLSKNSDHRQARVKRRSANSRTGQIRNVYEYALYQQLDIRDSKG